MQNGLVRREGTDQGEQQIQITRTGLQSGTWCIFSVLREQENGITKVDKSKTRNIREKGHNIL